MTQPDVTVRTLSATPLSAETFAPFGDVISSEAASASRTINYGHTQCFPDLARLDLQRAGGRPCISLYRSQPQTLPIRIRVLENHPLGSQTFMPLGDQPWLVVVAPAGPFAASGLRAFVARPDQGVNFHAGTWHHYSLALHAASDFLVLDWHGSLNNMVEVTLADTAQVIVELASPVAGS